MLIRIFVLLQVARRGLSATNTETFCIACHEMRDNVFQEPKTTVHYTNRSGVRAHCPDCHVPHNWTNKIARKMQASKEVWGKIFGVVNTREKFVDHRLDLAEREWARMNANGSLECRNATALIRWTSPRQSPRVEGAHQHVLFTGQETCIDCHKGIAHELPDMRSVISRRLRGRFDRTDEAFVYRTAFPRREERLVSSVATIMSSLASTAGRERLALFEYCRLRNAYGLDGALCE